MTQSIITKQQYVLNLVNAGVEKLLYYDRMSDQTLSVGQIERMLINDELSVDQLVNQFKTSLLDIIGPD